MDKWYYKTFDQLTVSELYEILKLRQEVFVIEQQCIYPDIDDADKKATHLFARDQEDNSIIAYLRIFEPGALYNEVAIGRVLTSISSRNNGLGRGLMLEAIRIVAADYPSHAIKISAQEHLKKFYEELSFVATSKPYDEDGIMHIDMIRS